MVATAGLAPATTDARQWQQAWLGKTVFVLASGPSLTLEAVQKVWHQAQETASPVMVTNTTFTRAQWADVLFFSHKSWWLTYQLAVRRAFKGWVATTANVLGPRVTAFTNGRLPEYGDTGANAIGLALYMGASRVVVLGLDGQPGEDGRSQWHAPHPPAVLARRGARHSEPQLLRLQADARQLGAEIINASPHSRYAGFTRAALAQVLDSSLPPPPDRKPQPRLPALTPNPHVAGWQGAWAGKTVFVLASGPSLTGEDVSAVRTYAQRQGCPVVVTNTTYRLAPWADLLFFYDRQWWRVHEEEVLRTFPGQLVTMAALQHPRILSLFGQRFDAYKNSGGGAISFAIMAGATRIILLGMDGQYAPDGRRHWHEQDPRLGNAASLPRFVTQFPALARYAERCGVAVVNATRQTALTCFHRDSLESILTTDSSED